MARVADDRVANDRAHLEEPADAMKDWLLPIAYGLLTLCLAEILLALLRRGLRGYQRALIDHLWAIAGGALVTLSVAPAVNGQDLSWRAVATAVAMLSAFVVFAVFEAAVLRRPWNPDAGPMMPKLARDVTRILLLTAVFLLAATRIFGANVSTVLVSSTVLSAVLGLALQPTLTNIFAGMSLQIERAFAIGDWLMLDGTLARIEEMTWRATRLRTNDGVEIYEPNANLATAKLQNYGSGAVPVAFNFDVSVAYDAPPAAVKRALLAAALDTPGVAEHPVSEAFLVGFGDSAINYRLRVWTHEVRRYNPLRDHVNSRIWYHLHRAHLTIPFPIRTVLFRRADVAEERRETAAIERSIALLAGLPLFDDLPPESLRRLATAARRELYDDGETLVREGERGDSLFVVEDGRVVVSKSGESIGTGTINLAEMKAGDFFGEMSLLTGEPRSATVSADGGCQVLVLTKDALAPIMSHDPDLPATLSHALFERRAEAAATFQDRQDRMRDRDRHPTEESLLARIKSFFKLPG